MATVRKRCVFYVSGFDPKGAGHYHGLYREQAALQEQAGGLALEVGPRKRLADGNAAWQVRAVDKGVEVQTHYEFMRWDDVVRNHWPRNRLALWRAVWVASLFNLRHGSLWRLFKLSWPPALALLIPFLVLLGLFVGGPALAWLLGSFAYEAAGWWGVVPAVAAVAGVLAWAERRLDARFNMYWLMRSYAFTRLQVLGRTPDLEARLDAQAAKLAQRLAEGGDDEVLVVGHSSGANMAVAIVARALRYLVVPAQAGIQGIETARCARSPQALDPRLRGDDGDRSGDDEASPLSLLTLGQCLPMLGTLPQAEQLRRDLFDLGQSPHLHWIDFSAPPDASCVALSDPIRTLGAPLDPPPRPDRPKLLNPRFAEMFDPAGYVQLRKDKFRMHFQYLMASANAVEYDYFRITAGARTLQERYAHCASVTDFHRLRPFGPELATASPGSPPARG